MRRRQAIKISSLGAIGFSASINTGCSNNTFSFDHGVASGDPPQERVILWTRVTPKKVGPIEVVLEISEKEDFSKVVFKKKLNTSSLADYTIKYDFKASKYFDVSINSLKLDKLVPSVLEAHKRCKKILDFNS